MGQDYFPRTDPARALWFQNYRSQIAIDGPTVGVTGASLAEQIDACHACEGAYADVQAKLGIYTGAVHTKDAMVADVMNNILRPGIGRIKTNAGYNPSIGDHLHIVGGSDSGEPEDYIARISAEAVGGFIRIKFVKGIAEGVNIYHRPKGSGGWQFLARDTKSPYDDHIMIPEGGAPQHWEYQAYGVINDAQIGHPSEIAEAVIG